MTVASPHALAPLMVYWEVTRACDLACRHCRATAVQRRDRRELTQQEGRGLLEALRRFGEPAPHLVFTGGDPLRRPDLFRLIAHAVALGLQVSVTPSATGRCTPLAIRRLKQCRVSSLAFSLDGASPDRHDRIRGLLGTFERTLQAIGWALELGLPVQVNTLVAAETLDDLEAVHHLVRTLGAQRWALFFLIGVGRGRVLSEVGPEDSERVLEWAYDLSRQAPPVIKATEAHHFRRIAAQGVRHTAAEKEAGGGSIRRGWGVRDGSGVMFISHLGDVYPSGFLPIPAGNVRRDDPVALYRHAPLFRRLRDPDALIGKCGRCEYRRICGGSRARAYAASGDPLGSDPLCIYEPGGATEPAARVGRAPENRPLSAARGAPPEVAEAGSAWQ